MRYKTIGRDITKYSTDFCSDQKNYWQKRNYVTLWIGEWFEQISWVYMVLFSFYWLIQVINITSICCHFKCFFSYNSWKPQIPRCTNLKSNSNSYHSLIKEISKPKDYFLYKHKKSSQVWTHVHADSSSKILGKILVSVQISDAFHPPLKRKELQKYRKLKDLMWTVNE